MATIGTSQLGRLLDVGAGDGYLTHQLSRHSRATIAIEPIDIPLCQAATGAHAIHWVRERMEDAILAGTFDTILLCHSLYFVADPQPALEKFIEHLAPGGVLIVIHHTWGGTYDQLIHVIQEVRGRITPRESYDTRAIMGALVSLKQEVSASTITMGMHLPSHGDVCRLMESTLNFEIAHRRDLVHEVRLHSDGARRADEIVLTSNNVVMTLRKSLSRPVG